MIPISLFIQQCTLAAFLMFHVCCINQIVNSSKLDEYIQDFQPLHLDTYSLHKKHERVRRSTNQQLHLHFNAYNRDFSLRLKRDVEIFSPDHETVESDGRLVAVDTSFIYTGHVEGVPKSNVHLAVINGSARGHIYIPGDTTYHIDPAEQYFHQPAFPAIIYPESRMDKDPFRYIREKDDIGSCGVDRVKKWMDDVAKSSVVDKAHNREKRSQQMRRDHIHSEKESQRSKYFAYSNTHGNISYQERKKRAPLGPNNTCFLYLRSDPMMWNYVKKDKFKQNLSDERAKEEILAFFASHVSALKNIFHRTTFTTYNNDLRYNGINFIVQRTSIMTPENQRCNTPSASSYCNPNIDVSNFLNLNSMDNHDEFCLAYIFTHRDFTRGTLGLAWVGAREVASGGICEKHKSYMERDETVPKSLNTGIVTTVNYGKAVPVRVSQLTFTHEVGHNFGSPHDQGADCAPFGTEKENAQDGNYIMFASATMGDRPNNDDFSICSKDNITRLLHVVVNELNGKRNCFKPSKTAFCGNGIKEDGEECDCGYAQDCEDRCCYGRDSIEGDQCTLKPTFKCSPTAGPCCTSDCEFVAPGPLTQCLPADDLKSYLKSGTKRKFKDEYIHYGFIALESKGCQSPFCLICNTALSNEALVPSKLKGYLETKHPAVKDKSKGYFENLPAQQTKEAKKLSTYMEIPEKGFIASYKIAHLLAKQKKAQTEAETIIASALAPVCGSFAECPAPKFEANGTSCNDDAQMCYNGECINSVCGRIGWAECFLTSEHGEDDPSHEALCYVSCTNPQTLSCVSSYDQTAINRPENIEFRNLLFNVTRTRAGKMAVVAEGIQLPAGSPCDNFRGYCDVFHKCRGVDADGPLARLKNIIFNPETLENIQQWIVKHWWAVLLMGIGLVVVMGAFIKICAVHTPSSNPRKPKHRQLTLPRTLQRRHHRQQQQNQSSGQNQGRSGGAGGRRPLARSVEERKPANDSVQIVQEPPPPYSSTAAPLTAIDIVATPSSSSSPSAPMIEPVRAANMSTIPTGGPKRGHGGQRNKNETKVGKGKKKGKTNVEMQRL